MVEDGTTPTRDEARRALAAAEASGARAQAQGRWTGTYMAAFGLGFGILTVLVGLIGDAPWALVVVIALWAGFTAVMVGWSTRQRATDRAAANRMRVWWVLTTVLNGLALATGLSYVGPAPAYWWPAGVVVALPLLLGAARERRV